MHGSNSGCNPVILILSLAGVFSENHRNIGALAFVLCAGNANEII
jgi:hypothetical protein